MGKFAFLADIEILLHVLVTIMLAALVGFDREQRSRPAGLRTHILVGASATLFVALGVRLTQLETFAGEGLRFDPIRILEAIITGVAFLGAGTIFFSRENGLVKGLTTAASLWITAGIGIAVALGQYVLATGVSILAFVVLRLFYARPDQYQQEK